MTTLAHARKAATAPAASLRGLGGLARARAERLGSAAVPAAAAAGILVIATPRGPVTTAGALAGIVVGLAAGVGAGYALRSRWAILAVPALLACAFELRWLALAGPSVDAPRLDTGYGILTVLLGRGSMALFVLLPAAVGATHGASFARRRARGGVVQRRRFRRVALYGRRLVAGLATAAVLALAALSARPATTPAILGPDGEPLPGSVATLVRLPLSGHDTWLSIRGRSVENPVLLYLSGGPGQTDLPHTRVLWQALERDFVVVNWDERGTGKAYAELDPVATLTVDGAVRDTVAVASYLRRRFDERRVYLVGESWGTLLGVLAVQRRPDLFHAYIGSGQMVDVAETDRRLHRDLLAYARRSADREAAETLSDFGPPPYDDPFASAYVMGYYDELAGDYAVPRYVDRLVEEHGSEVGPWGVLGSEYTLVDKVNVLRGLVDYFSLLYPQIQGLDLRRDATRLDVPVYLVQGRHELRARTALVPQWLAALEAPHKELVWFERAGHSTALEDPRRFHRLLTETIVPATYQGDRGRGATSR